MKISFTEKLHTRACITNTGICIDNKSVDIIREQVMADCREIVMSGIATLSALKVFSGILTRPSLRFRDDATTARSA